MQTWACAAVAFQAPAERRVDQLVVAKREAWWLSATSGDAQWHVAAQAATCSLRRRSRPTGCRARAEAAAPRARRRQRRRGASERASGAASGGAATGDGEAASRRGGEAARWQSGGRRQRELWHGTSGSRGVAALARRSRGGCISGAGVHGVTRGARRARRHAAACGGAGEARSAARVVPLAGEARATRSWHAAH